MTSVHSTNARIMPPPVLPVPIDPPKYGGEGDWAEIQEAAPKDLPAPPDPGHLPPGTIFDFLPPDAGHPAMPHERPPAPDVLPPSDTITDIGLVDMPVASDQPPVVREPRVNVQPRISVHRTADPAPVPTAGERDAATVGTPASGFLGGLTSMGQTMGSVLTDAATFVGVDTDEDGSLKAGVDPLALGGFGLATAGPTALMALGNRVNPLTGEATPYLDRFGASAAGNAIRLTPTLVSAVLGPAIADGVTMIAPNLVKKYKDPKDIKVAEAKRQVEKDNQQAKISRAVAGAVVVGLAAGAVFLLKPEIFKKFGMGVTHAIEGSTQFAIDGKVGKLAGVLDANKIRVLTGGGPSASVNILKTVAPMARDAVFTNRMIVAAAGGVGTLLLANKAAGEIDPAKQKLWWGITGAAALATVGGAYGIGKITQQGITSQSGVGGMLARNELLMKPNIEWIKKYATVIAPITAVPAGTAASQYFNIVNDFDEITNARSPFRK